MNKFLISGIVVVCIVIILSIFVVNDSLVESPSLSVYETGFTYYDIEEIQITLVAEDIFVSAPTAITDHTINEYCTFFDKGLPRTVDYCTTTAVVDSSGNTLGNINIGGSIESPIMAVANLETTTLESNQKEVFAVFETMIEILVCDCWGEEQSSNYDSISSWLTAVQMFHLDSDNRNIKSKIDNLGDSEITLEITSKDNSVLQTLIILK